MIHSYNIPVQKGWTPLLHATLEGYSNVVKLLIQHQVQLEIENNVSTHINIMNYKFILHAYNYTGGQNSSTGGLLGGPL